MCQVGLDYILKEFVIIRGFWYEFLLIFGIGIDELDRCLVGVVHLNNSNNSPTFKLPPSD